MLSRNNKSTRYAANLQTAQTPDSVIAHLPAVVATRFNPDMKAKYEQLISTGKCKKLAITAVMRKLIVTANALLRDQRKWTQNPA